MRNVTFFREKAIYWVSYSFRSPGNEVSTRWTPYAPPGNLKIVQEDHPMYCLDCPCLMAWVRLISLNPISWTLKSQIKKLYLLVKFLYFFLSKSSIPHQFFLLPACPTHVLSISRIFQLIAKKVKHRLPIPSHYTKGHKLSLSFPHYCQIRLKRLGLQVSKPKR